MYYPYSENEGADQLRGYHEADLRLCFRICKNRFSHDAAHFRPTKHLCIKIIYDIYFLFKIASISLVCLFPDIVGVYRDIYGHYAYHCGKWFHEAEKFVENIVSYVKELSLLIGLIWKVQFFKCV